MEKIYKLIKKVEKVEKKYGDTIPKPISNDIIEDFKTKFIDFFDEEAPVDYINFLKICNGLEFNGFNIFYASNEQIDDDLNNLFEINELHYEQDGENKKFIFYCISNQDLFAYNKENKEYVLMDRYSGDVYDTFITFEEMLENILQLMIE